MLLRVMTMCPTFLGRDRDCAGASASLLALLHLPVSVKSLAVHLTLQVMTGECLRLLLLSEVRSALALPALLRTNKCKLRARSCGNWATVRGAGTEAYMQHHAVFKAMVRQQKHWCIQAAGLRRQIRRVASGVVRSNLSALHCHRSA